ncbi:MAG: Fic family protein [Clostridia bacterium]|nr:Fic family protein [Clostridia bacterium]
MEKRELLEYFIENYYPMQEIVYRLPMSVPISEFWPEELLFRCNLAVTLPLPAAEGGFFWYVPTGKLLKAGDSLAEAARYENTSSLPKYEHDESIIDEAYYSSAIEGAYTTRAKAHELILSGKQPESRDERMIINNYKALRFVLDHLDSTINEAIVLEIARILTDSTLDQDTKPGWRDGPVQVISGRQEVVYTAPDADRIRPMLDNLFAFLALNDIHPVVKACAAHIYFVTVHPLFDGNGRTARALAYMVLLQSGYDFFRQVPISGLLSQERARYYKAIRASQDPANGNDFTYFMEYYTDMLFRSISDIHRHMNEKKKIEQLRKDASSLASADRLCTGLEWLYRKGFRSITTEKWKDQFKVSFETARKDLTWLSERGYLAARVSGHKKFFDVCSE